VLASKHGVEPINKKEKRLHGHGRMHLMRLSLIVFVFTVYCI
jgi:hypothetical protein